MEIKIEKIKSPEDVDTPRYQVFGCTPPRSRDIASNVPPVCFQAEIVKIHSNNTYLNDL